MTDQQQAASVKRLHPSLGDTWGMRESDDGEYVAFTVYAAAIAERDAVAKDRDNLQAATSKYQEILIAERDAARQECERLVAEVERLKKEFGKDQ